MEHKRILRGKRQLIWWICSYLIIMIIPVITGISIYARSLALLEDETIASHQSILTQTVNGIETKFDELDALIFQIRNEPEINRLLAAVPPLSSTQIYRVSSVMSMLRLYLTANDFLSDISVFYPRMSSIVSSMSKYDLLLYHSLYVEQHDISYRAWLDALNHCDTTPALLFGATGYYMASLSSAYGPNLGGSLIIRLNMDAIRDYVKSGGDGMSDTIVLDSNGALLLSLGDSLRFENIEWQDMADNLVEKNGVRYLASSVTSKRTGWRFIRLTPYEEVMRKAQPIINSAVFISAVTCIVCLLAAFLFAYLNYRPLSRLVRFVAKWSGSTQTGAEPEYIYLETKMQQLALDHTEMSHRLQQQSEQLGRNYLARLLRTQGLLDEIARDELATYGIEFPFPHFAVCIIQAKHLPVRLADTLPIAIEKFLANKIMGSTVLGFRMDKDIVLAINAAALTGSALYDAVSSLYEYICQSGEIDALICVSLVHTGIHTIPSAYSEAFSAFEQRRAEESQGIVVYSDDKRRRAFGDIFYPSGYDIRLINSVCAGDKQLITECIDDIYDQNTHGELTVRQCGYLSYHLCTSFMKAVNEVKLIYGISLPEISLQIEQQLGQSDLICLRASLITIAGSICDHISESARSGSLSVEKIKQYVQSRFSDPELNVNTLAEGLCMNPSYVSRVFNEKTGESLSAYIQQYRIEQSMESLAEKSTLSEVAERVGYLSTNTFIRAFKKQIGITPGKYKELQKQKLSMLSENDD